MKKMFIVCAALLLLLLSGCGGVSQEEYDKLAAEKEEASKELETIKGEKEELDKELTSAKVDYEKANQEKKKLQDENKKQAEAEMKLSTPKAWATTSFGDNCIMLVENEEYMQVICQEKYSSSSTGVQEAWNKVLSSSATLALLMNDIDYEKIGIKFLGEDGKELLEVVLKKESGTYKLHSILGNLEKVDTLVPAIMQIAK